MFEIFCGLNLSCHFNSLFVSPKYPEHVAEVCQYLEQQKIQLPEYCYFDIKQPRRRSEF